WLLSPLHLVRLSFCTYLLLFVLCTIMQLHSPKSTLFPYTTLFRSRPVHPPPGRPRRAPRGLRPPLRGAREHRRRRPRHPGVPRRRGLRGRDPPDLVRPPHLPPPRGRPLLRLLTASARR